MRIRNLCVVASAVWLAAMLSAPVSARQEAAASRASVPTFTKDVAPILFKNCVGCHRPGEIAPMSLLTYEDARPWAKAIRDEVSDGEMPPWHADAPRGTFHNERILTAAEKDTLVKWANGGAPKGEPKDMPPVPRFTDGWQVGKPDVVFEMAEEYKIPAEGTIQYEYFYIPTNFTEAKWVKSIEIRPSNRSVVHHVLMFYRAKPDLQRTPVFRPTNREHMRMPEPRVAGSRPQNRELELPQRILATYAPGTNPQVAPEGTAFRLEPGGILELQMHYTANGEATSDRTKVGLIFAKESDGLKELRPGQFFNATLKLPAGAADVAVSTEVEFLQDATVWGIFPHTHVRGKKWEYTLTLPDGTKKQVLSVPRYDFNWQSYYMFTTPLQIPKGAKLQSTAWYDNSARNKANPDPKADVLWGDQTWEEMQYTGIIFTPSVTPTPITSNGGGR